MSEISIFRVTVRGFFADLSATARAYLDGSRHDHDVSRAAFTGEGTFTYDARLDSFSLRYEVRVDGEESDQAAEDVALGEARLFLDTMGIAYRSLKVSALNMSTVWKSGENTTDP